MTLPAWIRLAEITLVLLLVGAVILAWREARNDRAQLQSQLAAANQAIAAATASQQDHNAKLTDALAAIAAEKKAATTPGQLLAGIAQQVGLPTPLSLQSAKPPANSPAGNPPEAQASPNLDSPSPPSPSLPTPSPPSPSPATTSTELPSAPIAQIPAADLQPLYDYALNRRPGRSSRRKNKNRRPDPIPRRRPARRQRRQCLATHRPRPKMVCHRRRRRSHRRQNRTLRFRSGTAGHVA